MRAIAISPDNRYLAGGGRNGKIRIWNAGAPDSPKDFVGHRQRIRAMSFSPDGKWLASCGDDRVIRISPIDGGEPYLLEGPPAKLMSLAYLGSREVAAGGSDNLIRIWDLDTRAEHSFAVGGT
jgi:WD40 repeat protein